MVNEEHNLYKMLIIKSHMRGQSWQQRRLKSRRKSITASAATTAVAATATAAAG